MSATAAQLRQALASTTPPPPLGREAAPPPCNKGSNTTFIDLFVLRWASVRRCTPRQNSLYTYFTVGGTQAYGGDLSSADGLLPVLGVGHAQSQARQDRAHRGLDPAPVRTQLAGADQLRADPPSRAVGRAHPLSAPDRRESLAARSTARPAVSTLLGWPGCSNPSRHLRSVASQA